MDWGPSGRRQLCSLCTARISLPPRPPHGCAESRAGGAKPKLTGAGGKLQRRLPSDAASRSSRFHPRLHSPSRPPGGPRDAPLRVPGSQQGTAGPGRKHRGGMTTTETDTTTRASRVSVSVSSVALRGGVPPRLAARLIGQLLQSRPFTRSSQGGENWG